jgi:signal transduction histidine kinase
MSRDNRDDAAKDPPPGSVLEADQVLGIAAHEIKNALGPLTMTLALCERRAAMGDAIGLEDLRFARSQVRRIAQLVNDLLDTARIDTGQLALRLAPVDLRGLVQETVETFRRGHPQRIVCDLPASSVVHTADAERLASVLSNFLDNAAKYAPERAPIQVRMSLAGDRVRIEVTDHGPGIRPEDRERIFERYYRAPSTAEIASGLGLGLFICRAIAEGHGGTVGVESVPGQGATFWLDLCLGET